MVWSNITCVQASVSLRSPSWNKAPDVDPTIGEAGDDTTLKVFGKKKKSKQICELWQMEWLGWQ